MIMDENEVREDGAVETPAEEAEVETTTEETAAPEGVPAEEETPVEEVVGEEDELPEATSIEEAQDGLHKVSPGNPYAPTPSDA